MPCTSETPERGFQFVQIFFQRRFFIGIRAAKLSVSDIDVYALCVRAYALPTSIPA